MSKTTKRTKAKAGKITVAPKKMGSMKSQLPPLVVAQKEYIEKDELAEYIRQEYLLLVQKIEVFDQNGSSANWERGVAQGLAEVADQFGIDIVEAK